MKRKDVLVLKKQTLDKILINDKVRKGFFFIQMCSVSAGKTFKEGISFCMRQLTKSFQKIIYFSENI
jgi:predicted chitinase